MLVNNTCAAIQLQTSNVTSALDAIPIQPRWCQLVQYYSIIASPQALICLPMSSIERAPSSSFMVSLMASFAVQAWPSTARRSSTAHPPSCYRTSYSLISFCISRLTSLQKLWTWVIAEPNCTLGRLSSLPNSSTASSSTFGLQIQWMRWKNKTLLKLPDYY